MKENPTVSAVSNTIANTSNTVSNEISRVAVTAFGVTAGLIGLWAVACMAAGLLNSGGPVTLISNLFKAILG